MADRYVSDPVWNATDGQWWNKVMVIDSDGNIVSNDPFAGPKTADLPRPWFPESNDYFLAANDAQLAVAGAIGDALDLAKALYQRVSTEYQVDQAIKKGGDPFSGTVYDRPYYKWPGTAEPWKLPPLGQRA